MTFHAIRVVSRAKHILTGTGFARGKFAIGKFTGDSGFSAFVEGIATYRAFGSHI